MMLYAVYSILYKLKNRTTELRTQIHLLNPVNIAFCNIFFIMEHYEKILSSWQNFITLRPFFQ